MPDGLANLYVELSLQDAAFLSGLEEAGAAGEEFTGKLLASLDELLGAFDELLGPVEDAEAAVDSLGESTDVLAGSAKTGAESLTDLGETAKGAADGVTGLGESAGAAGDGVKSLAEGAGASDDAVKSLTDASAGLSDSMKAAADAAAFEREMLAGLAEADAALTEASAAATEAIGLQARSMGILRDVTGTTAEVSEASSVKVIEANDAAADSATASAGHFKLLGVAMLAGALISIHMAGTFQQSMTRLVTSAGESQRNLAMVSQGIEQMSIATNTSMSQLASGMYYVESAGFHGASGLLVLKAAAQGAQAEGADLATVANAVTSALNAYGLKARSAMAVTDEMVTAVGRGKMTMQDLASAISTVLPIASKAGLSIAQVTGAIATMTAQGVSAQQATFELRHAISSLENPTTVQTQEMGQFGLSSIQVAKNLGHAGLTGTIQDLSEAILTHMGPSGLVLLKALNQSKLAAQSAQQEIAAMPPSLQKLATAYLNGSVSAQQWNKLMFQGSEPAKFKNLLQQFAATANEAHGFNNQLKAGGTDSQTFLGALSKMTGGITGAQVALLLGGDHAATFNANVNAIADSAQHAGSNVSNWALIQHNFNFQLGSTVKSLEAMAMSFGQVLLPAATAVLHVLGSFAQMIARNAIACKALAVIVGVLLAGVIEHTLVKALSLGTKGIGDMIDKGGSLIGFFRAGEDGASGFSKMLSKTGSVASSAWSGLLRILGLSTAATEAQTAASEAAAAAADTQAASEGILAAATEGEAAAAEAATVATTGLDVAMDANPIGLIVIAIAALVAGLVLLATHINWVAAHWKLLGTIAASVMFGPLGTAVMLLVDNFGKVEKAADALWHDVTKVFGGMAADFRPAESAAEGLAHGITSTWDNVSSSTRRIWGDFTGWLKQQMSVLTQFWAQHGQEIKEITHAVWTAVTVTVKVAMAIIVPVVKAAWSMIGIIFDGAAKLIEATVKILMAIVSVTITAGMAVIKTVWNVTWAIMSNLVKTTWTVIGDVIHAAIQFITGVIGIALDLITGHWSKAWHDLVTLTSEEFHDVVSIIESIASGFGHLLWDAGVALIKGLIGGIKSMVGAAVSAVHSVISAVGDLIPHSPAKKGPFSGSGAPFVRGQHLAAGLAAGMLAEQHAVEDAALRLVTSAVPGNGLRVAALAAGGDGAYGSALPAAGGTGGGGGGGLTVQVTINAPYGFVGTEQQLATALYPVIQRAVLEHGQYNGTTGFQRAAA